MICAERTAAWTTLICSDGIGSGIKANLAANLCVSRLTELLRRGFSLRQAFGSLVKTMNQSRDPSLPYACFSVARMLNDGEATVLSYEMPGPILISGRHAAILNQRTTMLENAVVGEAQCHLDAYDGILLVSDGITQAGLGMGLREGWTLEGLCDHVNSALADGVDVADIPQNMHDFARRLWRGAKGDDCTAILGMCRPGTTVNIFTGPPSNPAMDARVVRNFVDSEGWKVICGATTSQIVADHLGRELSVVQDDLSLYTPPKYSLEGIDLVTEGAVTLNQVYNIFEDSDESHEDSGVTQLCALLKAADRVNFIVGVAANPANQHIAFRQQGILFRARIVPLLTEMLRAAGKLVVVHHV